MSMQEVFREILLESEQEQETLSPSYLKRNIQIPLVAGKAMVFMGVRRSGKSTLMRQVRQEIASQQAHPVHAVRIHFFDERLHGIEGKDLGKCLDAYLSLHPEVSSETPLDLYLDELEIVPHWEPFIDRQLRNPHRRVFITGSSSRLLHREIATAMRGRSLAFEVFPFSFAEILRWENYTQGALRADPARVQARLEKYLLEGGFPEVVQETHQVQRKILQEYYEVMLLRDLLERNHETNVPLVRSFLKLLFQSFSSMVTLNKCHERLKSIGIKTDKSKLSDLLKWVEDCYLLFPVSLFTESFSKQNANPRKIYSIDPGLTRVIATQVSLNSGRFLENAAFLFLRAQGKSIHYYKTRGGFEVDFIVDGKELYQIADTIEDSNTLHRETRALTEAMEELGIKASTLVVRGARPEKIETSSGLIHVVEASQWLSHPEK